MHLLPSLEKVSIGCLAQGHEFVMQWWRRNPYTNWKACALSDFNLTEFLPYQLAVVASRVSRRFAERYRAEFGLTIPEWRVLAHLGQSGAVSVREIEARVDMDKSKISRAAARLEGAGLIEKRENAEDRRLLQMTLTPKGRDLMDRLAPIAETYQAELVAALGETAAPLRVGLQRMMQENE